MKKSNIIVVRIYITETSHLLNTIVDYLKSEEIQVSGVSVFRAISGFGGAGSRSTASLIDLSLSLPLIIEFFDSDEEKINKALEHLNKLVKPGHIIFWKAETIC